MQPTNVPGNSLRRCLAERGARRANATNVRCSRARSTAARIAKVNNSQQPTANTNKRAKKRQNAAQQESTGVSRSGGSCGRERRKEREKTRQRGECGGGRRARERVDEQRRAVNLAHLACLSVQASVVGARTGSVVLCQRIEHDSNEQRVAQS